MYTVKLFKTIWAEEPPEAGSFSETVGFYPEHLRMGYVVKMPFAPYPGLRISDKTEKGSFQSGEIIQVTWQQHTKSFICLTDDEAPFVANNESYDFDWLIDEALKDGWRKISK